MIVKNEAHVIKDTLDNLWKYIKFSYYVISDTGSTDDTKQIIRDFFKGKGVNGMIYDDVWKDFGFNRSLALKYAHECGRAKYAFIFDADDRIYGNLTLPVNMHSDSYYLKFGKGVTYKRVLLVNITLQWKFVGVLHEYISCINKGSTSCELIDGEYFIDSGKSGARSKDPDKYKKDALILENAFYEAERGGDHIKIRYAFYCAQSYRDAGDKLNAIKWYLKRVELKDWHEEVFFSYYMVGNLYNELKEPEKAVYYWSLSNEADRERCEGIYEIIKHFRQKDKSYTAYKYFMMLEGWEGGGKEGGLKIIDKLFVYYPIYDFLLDFEMSLVYFNIQKFSEGLKIYKKLFRNNSSMPLELMLNILETFGFYLDHIKENDIILNEYYLDFVRKIYLITKGFNDKHVQLINMTINRFKILYNAVNLGSVVKTLSSSFDEKGPKVFFSITTCKRYDLFSQTMNSFLINCKDISLINYFFCVDDNSSHEDRKKMITNYPFLKYYLKKEDEKGHVASMNIIWNKLGELGAKYWIHLEDDWLFIKPCNYIKKSIDFLEGTGRKESIHQILFNKNYAETISNYDLVGGSEINGHSADFILHIKDEPNLKGRNCAYWPHYSFRPSMCIVDTILKLGNYTSPNTFFEMDYANKYFNNGYKSAFFNEITCIHIGKLTSEKSSSVANAYALNNVSQFSGGGDGVESQKIYMNKYPCNLIKSKILVTKLFKNNNFGSSKKIINDILHHINVWKQIVSNNCKYFIIMKDEGLEFDVCDIDNKYDIIMMDNYYIIKRSVLINILEYIDKNGIIDNTIMKLFMKIDNLKIMTNMDAELDDETEISECFDFKLNENEYIYVENKDHFGNDIKFIKGLSVDELMVQCDIDDDAIAFNTLGYIKNVVDMDNLISLGNGKDGLYINIAKYNKSICGQNKVICIDDNVSSPYIRFVENYVFIPRLDHIGDDIDVRNNLTIPEMMSISDLNNDCMGFNTLGFFKSNIDINNLSKSAQDGIYIKRSRLIGQNMIIRNINTLDKEYKCDEDDSCIACNSFGYYKKELNLVDGVISVPEIYNNYLSINIDKYYKKYMIG